MNVLEKKKNNFVQIGAFFEAMDLAEGLIENHRCSARGLKSRREEDGQRPKASSRLPDLVPKLRVPIGAGMSSEEREKLQELEPKKELRPKTQQPCGGRSRPTAQDQVRSIQCDPVVLLNKFHGK